MGLKNKLYAVSPDQLYCDTVVCWAKCAKPTLKFACLSLNSLLGFHDSVQTTTSCT